MSASRLAVLAGVVGLLLVPAVAPAAGSTQCPQATGTAPHPDAQRAGEIIQRWHQEFRPGVGEQYSGHGVDNVRGAWYVGYAPGPLDEAAVRDRVLEVVHRNASREDAAWLRDHLILDPQRYSERELQDVRDRIVEAAAGGRFGTGWALGSSCLHGDVRRAELEIFEKNSTPEQREEARRVVAQHGDRALVVVNPGSGPSAGAGGPGPAPGPGLSATCPLVTPAPPPAEGRRGFVFLDQFCQAGKAVEADYDVVTDFGDGTREATPFRPGGLWLVGGDHAYRRSGRYEVVSTITDKRSGEATVVRRTVRILNAPLRRRAVKAPAFPGGRPARRVVAGFTDANPLARVADHKARVRWGDGTTSKGTIRRDGRGGFRVVARHRYARGAAIPRRIVVRITDAEGQLLRVTTRLARPAGGRRS